MTPLRIGLGLMTLALLTSWAAADPRIDALNAQIKGLRAEQTATLKRVHEWYTNFIKRDRFTEQSLEAERIILRGQEDILLAQNTNPATRKRIVAHYETLRGMLRVGEGLKEAEIAQLRLARANHEAYIKAVYTAKIDSLKTQIQVIKASTPKKPK